MKKCLLFVAAAMAVTMLSVPMAYAAPSPTEPDRIVFEDPEDPADDESPADTRDPEEPRADLPPEDTENPEVPPVDVTPPDVTPPDINNPEASLVNIEDPEVPLAFLPSPQTGVSGLEGMEALTLAAVAFTASGAVILAKARKQTGSVR